MTRARFWLSQIIWMLAIGISAIASSEGDGGAVPFILLVSFMATGFINHWGSRKQKNQDMAYNSHMVARVMATAFIWLIYMAGTVVAVT